MNDDSSPSDSIRRPGEGRPMIRSWDGQPQGSEGEVALVVLGSSAAGGKYPTPLLAAALGRDGPFIVRPLRIGDFFRAHRPIRLVCEQSGSLHGMLAAYLESAGDKEALDCLWGYSRDGRLIDVTLLDQLVDLAVDGVERKPNSLEEIAHSRCGLTITSSTDLQARVDRYQIATDPGLDRDAIERVESVMAIYGKIGSMAAEIAGRYEEEDGTHEEVGPLSLGIQVRGAVALDRINRRVGLRIEAANDLIDRCREVYRESSILLRRDPDSEGCFQWRGDLVALDAKGHPIDYGNLLKSWLEKCVGGIQGRLGLPFRPPYSASGKIARSPNAWDFLGPLHPGLDAWRKLETSADAIRLLIELRQTPERLLLPYYQVLPRVRSALPNLGSLRRLFAGPIFTAPAGRTLLVGELCDLELHCVADAHPADPADGPSLSGLLAAGRDPIRHAAAALYARDEFLADLPFYEAFDALERENPTTFRAWMTTARTVLQLAPRGLSAESIARLIRAELGEETNPIANLAIPRACPIILDEIFPELHWIGLGWTTRQVSDKLCIDPREAFYEFGDKNKGFDHELRDVIAGRRSKPELLKRLRELCTDEGVKKRLKGGSSELYDEIFRGPGGSGYGRVRTLLESHQSEAESLLDRADDIRKSVLYGIVAAGYELAATDGDDFVLLVPDRPGSRDPSDDEVIRKVEDLVKSILAEFLAHVPARCRVKCCHAW